MHQISHMLSATIPKERLIEHIKLLNSMQLLQVESMNEETNTPTQFVLCPFVSSYICDQLKLQDEQIIEEYMHDIILFYLTQVKEIYLLAFSVDHFNKSMEYFEGSQEETYKQTKTKMASMIG